MSLFSDMRGGQFKPGPGVDTPSPSSGFPRFWYILRTFPGKLIAGNMLFILLCVPVVTAPAALCGLNTIAERLMKSGHSYPGHDFFEGFGRRFWSKTLFGLPFFMVIAGTVLLYASGARGALLCAAVVVACYFFLAACCFFVTVSRGDEMASQGDESDPQDDEQIPQGDERVSQGDESIPRLFLRAFVSCLSGYNTLRLLPALLLTGVFIWLGFFLFPVILVIGISVIVILAHAAL